MIGDDVDSSFEIGPPHAESRRELAPTSYEGIRAVLWIPDPEQRHGWREFYIRDPEPPKPGRRVGF